MLDVCPVRRYPAPRYPTKLAVLADTELLGRCAPPSWRASRTIAGAAALLLAASGCSEGSPPRAAPRACVAPSSSRVVAPVAPRVASLVAPIFAHGEGRGSTGCIVINPPVFLSEEEALQVIREELGRRGVRLGGPAQLPGVTFRRPAGEAQQPLVADGVDRRRNIGVEFVSEGDEEVLVDRDPDGSRYFSSVTGHAFKELAQDVAARVRAQGPRELRFGVFYDPVARAGERSWRDWERNRGRAAARSRQQLRAQVVDFVSWLIGQGAL